MRCKCGDDVAEKVAAFSTKTDVRWCLSVMSKICRYGRCLLGEVVLQTCNVVKGFLLVKNKKWSSKVRCICKWCVLYPTSEKEMNKNIAQPYEGNACISARCVPFSDSTANG